MTISYTVDKGNRITAIEGPWDDFAIAGGAPALTSQNVVGTAIFGHVSGPARIVVGLLLDRARAGKAVRIHFRCDAPAFRRFLRLEMRLLPDGGVRCDSTVERQEQRPPQLLLDPTAAHSDDIVVVCSWCNRVRLPDDRWVEVEEAVEALNLFLKPSVPQLSHGICDPCMESVRLNIASDYETRIAAR